MTIPYDVTTPSGEMYTTLALSHGVALRRRQDGEYAVTINGVMQGILWKCSTPSEVGTIIGMWSWRVRSVAGLGTSALREDDEIDARTGMRHGHDELERNLDRQSDTQAILRGGGA